MSNTELWTAYKKNKNVDLKKQIIVKYLNLIHYVIQHSKFVRMNVVDDKDFFQFGIEGLSEAIDRFDPDYGTKFETYAIQRIRGKIIDEIRKVQIKPRVDDPNSVFYSNVSMDDYSEEEESYTLHETLPSDAKLPDELFEKNEDKEKLLEAIKKLGERDRLIITLYYYENLNYQEIATVLNVNVSRISQIHSRIINELRNKLKLQYA